MSRQTTPPMRLRVAAVIVGLVTALAPAALISYDATTATPKGSSEQVVVATATATPTASSSDDQSGPLDQSGALAVAYVLVVLVVGVIAGGRVLSTRRDIW